MGRLARKKQHKGDKPLKEKYRTKRKTKDLDEIHEDMKPGKSQKLLNQEADFDKPGAGQFYCLHCAYVPDIFYYLELICILIAHLDGPPFICRLETIQEC